MKRRITPEQLNELTETQKTRLRDWWKPALGDWAAEEETAHDGTTIFRHFRIYDIHDRDGLAEYWWPRRHWEDNSEPFLWHDRERCLPLLDIDQMIDILDTRLCYLKRGAFGGWEIRLSPSCIHGPGYSPAREYSPKRVIHTTSYGEDLLEALWTMIKGVL